MSTVEKIAKLRAGLISFYADCVDELLEQTESPIETLFLVEVLRQSQGEINYDEGAEAACRYAEEHPDSGLVRDGFRGVGRVAIEWAATVYVVQPRIDLPGLSCRVDFAFLPGLPAQENGLAYRVAIELDGHDFHERTKEQARRDKSRDRALQTAGWTVLRFAGSEVYADPERCVGEVHRAAYARLATRSA